MLLRLRLLGAGVVLIELVGVLGCIEDARDDGGVIREQLIGIWG